MIARVRYTFLALFCIVPMAAIGATYSAYSIGNSLTWDSQPDGIAAMAASQGISLQIGYHIRASETLTYIASNPADVSITNGYGPYDMALPDDSWTFVSMQPFPDYAGGTSTQKTDLTAIGSFITVTGTGPSVNSIFYIYEGWPPIPCWCYPALPGETYFSWWNYPSVNAPATETYLTRAYFGNLYNDAKRRHPGAIIYMIPVGEVLARLAGEISAGKYPEFSSIFDLYRDDYHLSYDVGRFVAAATVFATYFERSPEGVPVPAGYYTVDGTAGGAPGLLTTNTALRNRLERLVWNVVSHDTRARGIGTAAVRLGTPLEP